MKKLLWLVIMASLFLMPKPVFAATAAGLSYYHFEIVDENGERVTDSLTVVIHIHDGAAVVLYNADGTVYDADGSLTVTTGYVAFYSKETLIDVYVDNATNYFNKDSITGSNNRLVFFLQGQTMTSLSVTGAIAAGGTLTMGTTGAGVDSKFWGGTAGDYFLFDESEDDLLAVGSQLKFDDDSDAIFGTDEDWVLDSDTATKLDFIPLTTDETSAIRVGANTAGADLMLYGATTGEYWLWDASADSILPNCGNALFTMTDAEANQFKVDATGTVAGIAIQLETTSGGIQLLADGAGTGDITLDAEGLVSVVSAEAAANQFKVDAQGTVAGNAIVLETTRGGILLDADHTDDGDIGIDAADDMTLTAGGNLTLAVTGTFSAGGTAITNQLLTTEVVAGTTDALNANQSGSVIVYTMTGGSCTVTLPDAAAGLWYILVDGNPAAGNDLTIDPAVGDGINGDTAGEYIKNENDRDGEGVFIFATSGTAWYTAAMGTSTVWTEE